MSEIGRKVRGLVEGLKADEWQLRESSAWRLGKLDAAAAAAVPVLVQSLSEDRDTPVRAVAAWAIGRIGPAEAVPALTEALKDAEWLVRTYAAWTLGQAGPAAADAVPALTAALTDRDLGVREAVRTALRAIQGQ